MPDDVDPADAFGDGPGTTASHDVPARQPLLVAPTSGSGFNTIRFRPVPIACARLNRTGFDFDSSLMTPAMIPALNRLGAAIDENPDAPLAIFGHADPVGDDVYNKTLSGRRAMAVFALLTRQPKLWEKLFTTPMGGDDWRKGAVRIMLGHLRRPENDKTFLDDAGGSLFKAIRTFQEDNNPLVADGVAGPKTREQLLPAYMDAICIRADGTSFQVAPERFIGQNEDEDGKGAFQGCGEFNPVFLFSQADAGKPVSGPSKEDRDTKNGINRRVMVFLFRPGTEVPAAQWPCPRASEDGAGCKAQFWPDGEVRRQPGDAERRYRVSRDTFACRFYDGFARRSPCEGVSRPSARAPLARFTAPVTLPTPPLPAPTSTTSLPTIFLRATYFNPLTKTETPLPFHQTSLISAIHVGALGRFGFSDGDGVTALQSLPQDLNPSEAFEIAWAPIASPGTPAGPLIDNASGLVWIDLEKNEWVPLTDVGALEKRKLMRLWSWSSSKKALAGGFLQSFNGAFASTGTVSGQDLAQIGVAFGSRENALQLKVDHQLFRSNVQFLFYDLAAKRHRAVPPGIVLSAFDGNGTVVGGGTAIDDIGTIHVLHKRTSPQSQALHYGFDTPANQSLVDLTATPPTVVREVGVLPTGAASRYLLPARWHSKGWQARITTRGDWDTAIHNSPTDLLPLTFHLDDAVLVTSKRDIENIAPPVDITVFDQLLVIRDPRTDQRDPRNSRRHVSGPELRVNYLPAEDRVIHEGQGLRQLSRLFHCDGKLYSLREERRDGIPNQTELIGARLAVHNDHPKVDFSAGNPLLLGSGAYELHLIDTLVDDFMHPSSLTGAPVACRLFHLMPFAGFFIDQGNANADDVKALLKNFDLFARVWNAGHPSAFASAGTDPGLNSLETTPQPPPNAVPLGADKVNLPGGKFYAIVADKGLLPGQPIILVRHFFGQLRKHSGSKGVLELDTDEKRAFNRAGRIHVSPAQAKPDSTKFPMEDPDGMRTLWMVVAHEIGHSLSVPDEYLEREEDDAAQNIRELIVSRHGRFSQSAHGRSDRFRPFEIDLQGMMRRDGLPRLRYYWPYVHALNHEPAFSGPLGSMRYVVEHRSFPGGPLVYRLPKLAPGVLSNEEDHNPWQTIGEVDLKPGHARLGLYRLGADESAAGGILRGPHPVPFTPLNPFADGALVVSIRMRFITFANLPPGAEGRAADRIYFELFQFPSTTPVHRFALDSKNSALKRVVLIFEPLFHTEPALVDFISAKAHVRIEVIADDSTEPNSLLLPEAARPGELRIKASEVNLTIVRHALGLPTFEIRGGTRRLLGGPLTDTELQASGLIAAVNGILQEPTAARRVVVV